MTDTTPFTPPDAAEGTRTPSARNAVLGIPEPLTWREYQRQHNGGYFSDWTQRTIEALVMECWALRQQVTTLERRLNEAEGGK